MYHPSFFSRMHAIYGDMNERPIDGHKHSYFWPIRTSYLSIQALQEPFVVLYSMLVLLITKNMGASPFQIALLNMLKPTVSVISFYWGSYLHTHPALTRPTLILLTLFSTLPFIVSPYITDVWIFIALGAWYSLCSRAAIPASLEILKCNTEKNSREKLFSHASILAYVIGGVLSLIYGAILDVSPQFWSWLISIAAIIHISSIVIQKKLPAPEINREVLLNTVIQAGKESSLTKPWAQAKELMAKRPDFLRFQLGFSIAGFGLMFAQPAIPGFVTGLPLSYMELFIAFSFLKGFGFILTSPIWAKLIANRPIHVMSSWVFLGFALFLITLTFAIFNPWWIFASYCIYGIAQAGSHLVWNLSGSAFAETDTSTPYSSVNVLMVGIRGAIAPPLGGLVTELLGSPFAMFIGACLCLLGTHIVVSHSSCEKCIDWIQRKKRLFSFQSYKS